MARTIRLAMSEEHQKIEAAMCEPRKLFGGETVLKVIGSTHDVTDDALITVIMHMSVRAGGAENSFIHPGYGRITWTPESEDSDD